MLSDFLFSLDNSVSHSIIVLPLIFFIFI